MRALIIVFLIVLQLALQIGVPVHKHFCQLEGTFASVLIKVDHQCAEPHSNLPPCCQKEKYAKDCCTDELQVIHTYIDEVQPSVEQFNLVCDLTTLAFTPTTIFLHSWPISIQRHPSFLDKRPPPLHRTGRHIQTLHQIWQIWIGNSIKYCLFNSTIVYENQFFNRNSIFNLILYCSN